MNLREDIRTEVLAYLPYDKNDSTLDGELKAMDAGKLLSIYMGWRARIIHPHRRKVNISKELLAGPVLTSRQRNFAIFRAKIENGDQLWPHLSRKIENVLDLDLLLNDWGIHHFHLSETVDPDGFVSRPRVRGQEEPLLFAIFKQSDAYLLDFGKHGDWYDDRFPKIAHYNWANARLYFFVPGMKLLDPNKPGEKVEITTEMRKRLRNSRINTGIEIPEGLLMSLGATIRAELAANKVWNNIALFEIALQRSDFPELFRKETGKDYPTNPSFHFRFFHTALQNRYEIHESESNCSVLLHCD